MAFYDTLTRIWDRTTARDGLFLQAEFERILGNTTELKALTDGLQVTTTELETNKVDKVTGKGLSTVDATLELIECNSIPLGMPFPQWFEDNAEAVVAKYPSRFIKLTKDISDTAGEYNYLKLGTQEANTANETTFYTALITVEDSPLNGLSVTLINSTENTTGTVTAQPSFLGASDVAQDRIANQGQGHKHLSNADSFSITFTPLTRISTSGSTGGTRNNETSTPTDDGTNGTPRTGKTTAPDTVTAVYYMRIK